MAEAADSLQEGAVLVHEIGQLRVGGLIAVGILATLALSVVVLWLVLRHREKVADAARAQASERAKDERARRTADGLTRLTAAVNESLGRTTRHLTQIEAAVVAFNAVVNHIDQRTLELERQVARVIDKQDGKLTNEQTHAIVESFFFSVIFEKSFGLVTQSMLQNNYDTRRAFVEERIKTDVARVLYDVRASLKALPLSFRPEVFFRRRQDEGERFILCDAIWETIEPLLRDHATPVAERINEVRYKILNVVKDYYEDCRQELTGSGSHRAPDPKEPKRWPSSASIRPS